MGLDEMLSGLELQAVRADFIDEEVEFPLPGPPRPNRLSFGNGIQGLMIIRITWGAR